MITFELVDCGTDGTFLKTTEGGKTWWVSSQDSPRWKQYLLYTAWVEAGNAPEDFWTQPSE